MAAFLWRKVLPRTHYPPSSARRDMWVLIRPRIALLALIIAAILQPATHTLSTAAATTGEAWAWGDNQAGNLGNGDRQNRHHPAKHRSERIDGRRRQLRLRNVDHAERHGELLMHRQYWGIGRGALQPGDNRR
jgi:alpha-tubulin suppressor-like RCC1 family protein